jgi:hypothetical protein
VAPTFCGRNAGQAFDVTRRGCDHSSRSFSRPGRSPPRSTSGHLTAQVAACRF